MLKYILIKKIYSFLIARSVFREYLFIFVVTGAVLLIKFYSLFTTNALLPGWDTLGHYYALLKSIFLLQEGELRGYMLNWFGGMPVFYFYPPLAFWLMAIVTLIFPHLSYALILKGFLFLSLASVPVTFHFFARSFLPGKIHLLATLGLGLAYIFYQPFEYGSLGIGIAGAIPVGLFITPLATSLVLVFLVHFRKLLINGKKKVLCSSFFWSLVFGSLIVYLHILSMIFAAFFGALILCFYLKRENIRKVFYLILGLLLTGAYALYPLFAYLEFSSGWRVDSLAYFPDPLLPLLAFDPSDLLRGDFLSFNWVWFFIFIFFIIGIVKLFRQRQYLLPTLFFISFILVPRDTIARIFPTFPIHYYRIMPLILFLYLTIGVFGVQGFFLDLSKKKYELLKYIIIPAFAMVLFWQIYFFSFLNSGMNIKPRIIDSYSEPIQYYEYIHSYSDESQARKTMKYFFDQKVTSRVVPTSNGRTSMIKLGSAHYFDTLLPMINNTPVIFGLYAESAYQVPFLFTPLEILTNLRFAYGNVMSLMADGRYTSQPPETAIKELSLFNAEYFIMDSDYNREAFIQETSSIEKINLDEDITPFEVYRVKDVLRGYITSPKYLPALYINEDKQLSFRDFALGWYKMIDILDFPVIFDDREITDINQANLENISFLIVHADSLSSQDIEQLQTLNKKIVVLSQEKYQGSELPEDINLIEDFKPGVGYYGDALPESTNYEALDRLENIFKEIKDVSINNESNDQSNLQASVWQDERIAFSGKGPIIVNASYFPNWRSENSEQKVYQVTPGQMLVFADGQTTLEFSASRGEQASGWLAVIAIILLISSGVFFWKQKKSRRKKIN